MKENYVEPMVVDKNGNIYYSSKCINELEDEKSKEIERLTELCNKYEEEHKTTFETWQKDIKEIERLNNIIKEVREYANKYNDKIQEDILEILDKAGEE